jgi:DNA (cytosine-5)-methyltransferase 1
VRTLRPKLFLIENVEGLMTHDQGSTLQTLLDLLSVDGLYLLSVQVLNAYDYGVPQSRKRPFIVGQRVDCIHLPFQFPLPFPEANKRVLRDALENCPPGPGLQYSPAKAAVMALVPEGGCWVDLPPDVRVAYMGNAINSTGGQRGIARRLHRDRPSLTLLTSPSQKRTERCHPVETRPLTTREYARIQSFPDSYVFAGGVYSVYKQIGNSVPVLLAEAMGAALSYSIP